AWTRMRFGKYIASKSYSKENLSVFLKYAIPIIPGAASWWIITMSDRYFITAYLGMDANGIYAVANKIPAILLMMNTVFSLAWKDNAIISFDASNKNAYYSNVFRHFFRLMTTAVICLTLLAKPILALVIGASFYSAWQYIGILLLGTLFNAFSLFWAAGYHGAKKTNVIFVTSIIGAFVNVLFNVIFIQFLGMYAVVISTFLALLITWVLRLFSAKPYFNIKMNVRGLVVFFILIPLAIFIRFIFNEISISISICLYVFIFIGYNWTFINHQRQPFHITLNFHLRRSYTLYTKTTFAAFQKALNHDALGLEMDLQLPKDDKLVVCHDHKLSRLNKSAIWHVKDYQQKEIKK